MVHRHYAEFQEIHPCFRFGHRSRIRLRYTWRFDRLPSMETVRYLRQGRQMDPNLPSFLLDPNGDLKEEYRNLQNYWRLGPYFHIVRYGRFIDTKTFQGLMNKINSEDHYWPEQKEDCNRNVHEKYSYLEQKRDISDSGWMVKKIHPKEDLRSTQQTIAYLLSLIPAFAVSITMPI